MKNKISNNIRIIAIILGLVFVLGQAAPTRALTLQEQRDQQAAIAAQAKKNAEAKQQQAAQVQQDINAIKSDISTTQSAINNTQTQIDNTQTALDDLAAKITADENKLAEEKGKLNDVLASWYMEGDGGLFDTVLSANNISDITDKQQYYDSIKAQISSMMDKYNADKLALKTAQDAKNQQLAQLNDLKKSQTDQQGYLVGQQQMQNRLLTDTTNAIADYQSQQAAAEKKIAEINVKIAALTATKSWGTQIVSGSGTLGVPYYMQTGNYTHLGNSPYTVSQYGCLITSFAMVSTYYGHSVTPSDIASNDGIFSRDGYLLVSPPPATGLSVISSGPVDWLTVNQELNTGHPVIISIYLPSVGAINSDGSSHFIVLTGRSSNGYTMNDPIGPGRGYNLSQVRSMKIIRG